MTIRSLTHGVFNMQSESMSSLMLDALESHHRIGKALIGAYARGESRLIDRPWLRTLRARSERIDGLCAAGAGKISSGADVVLDLVHNKAATVVATVAAALNSRAAAGVKTKGARSTPSKGARKTTRKARKV